MDFLDATRRSYDATADDYAEWIRDELAAKPFDRAVLAVFAELVRGPVADVGCGTGRITAHLAGLGVDVAGVDLSPGMLAAARRTYPHLAGGHEVELTFHHRTPDEMADLLRDSGFTVRAQLLRAADPEGPYPEQTPQAYVLAFAHG